MRERSFKKQPDNSNQADEPTTLLPSNKSNWLLVVIIMLAFLSVIWAIGVTIGKTMFESKEVPNSLSAITTTTPVASQTIEWKTYRNELYRLELGYPQSYSLKANEDKIEINSPLSRCNPKLVFNTDEYGEMYELQIFIEKFSGSLEKVLKNEGGENYGWRKTIFSGKKGYSIEFGAEMITPLEEYLVESQPDEVFKISVYIFGSDDQGRCNPRLDFMKAVKIKNQIFSTFKFLNTAAPSGQINALDIYQPGQLSEEDKNLLTHFFWPKLRSFKSGDQTRPVYLVNCEVTNDEIGLKLTGIPEEVPNVPNIAEVTLKKMVENHLGGFPGSGEIANYEQYSERKFINRDSGINGLLLKSEGTLVINFYDSVAAYGGGSSRVSCLGLSSRLTAMQFPTVKKVVMCINKFQSKPNDCEFDFQP